MTVAQKLELKGIEKGRLEGIQLGEARGGQEGKLAVARTMVTNGLDRNLVMKMTGPTADDLTKIQH
ncbi:hypothetical protein M5J15_16310 (plasmid) [Serratia symbiotica]|nr:hypothetical protein [Serratia symbiotica]USS96918.1 hypothetical protein M5J15_16310 [Serratia symbiotica]